ncbi:MULTISPECIES: inositol monophosphatase family protein [Virgibacillus]|uniref:inositol-phosphate phosphatase n=1 Tax=Virgibacillus kapii TaxID=1638645 RepID=A0ABQ2D288_9BACI|nr:MULTISPECIES: inositol monophosphatase family protein [Virgibacillus]EQB36553.1 hypothetical protein M948_16095 [Virgibacillus sp. CM-4]GGJ42958.1 inositol-1-monophosphatase [Virgibacillus kapii]
MNTEVRETIFQHALEWVLEAGKTIRAHMNDPLTIDTKSNANDLVTTMDRDIEAFFTSNIKQIFPDHFILSEEGFGDQLDTMDGTVWIIDPIDGTMNFVHQKRNFAISVGIYQDGIGEIGFIYNVMEDVLYSAKRGEGAYKGNKKLPALNDNLNFHESIIGLNHFWLCENRLVDERVMQQLVKDVRGTRTYGSAALEFASVAEGILDGYLTLSLSPWDLAAGMVIVNEVGGMTTTIDGEKINMLGNNSVFTCNSKIHQRILESYLQEARK